MAVEAKGGRGERGTTGLKGEWGNILRAAWAAVGDVQG